MKLLDAPHASMTLDQRGVPQYHPSLPPGALDAAAASAPTLAPAPALSLAPAPAPGSAPAPMDQHAVATTAAVTAAAIAATAPIMKVLC